MKPDIDARRSKADLLSEIAYLQAQVSELRSVNKGLQADKEALEHRIILQRGKLDHARKHLDGLDTWLTDRKEAYTQLSEIHSMLLEDRRLARYYDGKFDLAFDVSELLQEILETL